MAADETGPEQKGAEETGRKGGGSAAGRPAAGTRDTGTKTARPTSVGPHHATRDQEDPGNPGVTPEEGYGAEIARNNEAASGQPADPGKQPVLAPKPKTETADESGGTEEMLRKSGPPRDAPPLTGTTGD